jgi:SAM-dependent methyltransferase
MLDFEKIPDKLVKRMLDPRGYEGAYFVGELVADRKRVLSVGGGYGRDYYYLSVSGKEVIVFDIAPQSHLPCLVLGDITKGTPFANGQFDAVIMGEILEHLIDDKSALIEARRILADDGVLIVTVPFYNDASEYHVRVHSPLSIRRLLAACGFSAEETIFRGGLISFASLLKKLRSLLYVISFPFLLGRAREFRRERFKESFCRTVAKFDMFLGKRCRFLLKFSKYRGCYILARKAEPVDFAAMNVEEFSR